jgi:hypothetical protein
MFTPLFPQENKVPFKCKNNEWDLPADIFEIPIIIKIGVE